MTSPAGLVNIKPPRSLIVFPSGGMREGRVLSISNPFAPAAMKRGCQHHTQVFALSVARMMSSMPAPWADSSTNWVRQTRFSGLFQSGAIRAKRVRSGKCEADGDTGAHATNSHAKRTKGNLRQTPRSGVIH